MTRRVLGPKGSPRRRWTLLLPFVAMFALGLFYIAGAQAVHNTGAFELDGNATSASTDDWDRVCHEVLGSDCSTSSDTTGALATSWTAEPDINATIFTGGGSKDPQDVDQWAWKDGAGGLPDKDNLLHGFAAQYALDPTAPDGTCPNGTGGPGEPAFDATIKCVVLYSGSDRYDNSGDAQQGFWFFQNPIGFGSNSVGGGTGFTGVHRNGDVLVISDFSNGGTTATITVYKWDSTCTKGATKPNPGDCGDANLRLLSTSTSAKCAPTLADNDNACGIVNPDTITLPWSFTDKSGTANNGALNGEFYEGGVNLSELGLAGECFSSVASETRSSTSTTATLKDFILGQFAPCESSMTTTPKGATAIGNAGTATVSDDATLTVSGLANPPAPTGTVGFYLCGPSTGLSSCSSSSGTLKATVNWSTATKNGNAYTINSGNVTVSSAGDYCWFATWAGDSNYPNGASHDSSDECFTIAPRQPALTTAVSDAGPVTPGTAVKDTATFTTSPVTPSNGVYGKITFTVYGPKASSTADCTGTPAYTSDVNVVAGQSSYASDTGTGGAFAPTGPGFYFWIASYAPGSGDANNKSATTACGDSGESFQVQTFKPSLTTAQTWTVKDSVTVTVSGGGNLAGTAHFELHKTSDCSDAAVDTQNVSVSGASPQTVSTTVNANTTFTTSQPTLYWKVSYTSTNPAQDGIAATCKENSSVTISNG